MNKKLLILLFLTTILSFSGYSQVYTFQVGNQPYQELANPISINNGEVWDFPEYEVNLGFNFYLFDTLINKIYFFNEGQGSVLSSVPSSTRYHKMVMAFGAGLLDRGYGTSQSQSPLSYEVSGEPGTRICKIQWKNAGFYGDYEENGSMTDYVNFQLWLHEVTGLIEMHYGPSLITDFDINFGAPGPTVGLVPWYDNDEYNFSPECVWLAGVPANPYLVYSDEFSFLNGMIPPNTAYYFTNTLTVNTGLVRTEAFSVFPNPADDYIVIRQSSNDRLNKTVIIRDLTGRVMLQKNYIDSGEVSVPVGSLPSGVYSLLLLDGNKQIFTETFLKK